MRTLRVILSCVAVVFPALPSAADLAVDGESPIAVRRAQAAIDVDGDLSYPGWRGASEVRTWFETNPGDNLEPKVENVAYLAYDERFLYAGFRFADPEPEKIRAPLGDQRALRPLLPREAAVLPGGHRPLPHPGPGGLHPQLHRAALGRAGDRQEGQERLHPAGGGGPRRRQRDPPRHRLLGPRRAGLRVGGHRRPLAPRLRPAVVRELPLERPGDRRRRLQPGLRPRLRVAPHRP